MTALLRDITADLFCLMAVQKKWVNPEISCECFWSMDQRTSFALPDMGKHQKRSKDETHLPKLTAVLCL